MNQEAKAWMEKAIQDINSAKHLFETYYPKPLDTICYISQQGAEKSIKAVFASINYRYGT